MGQWIIEMTSFAEQCYTAERTHNKKLCSEYPKAIDFQITIEKSTWCSYKKTSPFKDGRVNLSYENKKGSGFNLFP